MPSSVVITERIFHPNGHLEIQFEDGTTITWEGATTDESLALCQRDIDELDSNTEQTRFMAIGWIKSRQPDLSNMAPIQNKTFSYDLSNPNAIRVQ